MKLHHIGIFVENQNKGLTFFKKLIKIKKKTNLILDKNLGVKVRFIYDMQNNCYEIVSPYTKKNPVKKILAEKKNIINHFAYKTNKFEKTILHLRKINCAPLSKPKYALAFKRKVIFFLTPLNFIIEIIED